jgi:tRNA A-37 threonylcarbamoyl transferase component Bud32
MIDQDPSVLPPGTRIDQYEISQLLGRGGFGITYLVRDDGLAKDFALKEFFPEDLVRREGTSLRFASKPNSENDYRWGLRKFYDEARLLAQFNHSNIVNVRRVFEANNSAYMLLDFIKGSTLEKWLQGLDSPPTQEELDLIAAPLLSALELVHENRTWHLDISPENVMIRSSDGAPILLDFGASRFEMKQHSQLVSALVFKSGYSAPEQYTSNADRYGPWTDIYAFGAMLYRAVSGERPSEATARQMHDEQKPATQSTKGAYRDKFLKAIDWALRLRPQDRPQSIGQWREMLLDGSGTVAAAPAKTRALMNASTRVLSTPAPAPVSGTGRNKRTMMTAAGALGALLALAFVVDQVVPDHRANPVTYVKMAAGHKPAIGPSGPSAAAGCGREPCWGVVVEKEGAVFARVKEPSKEVAETGAMNLCAKRVGATGCKVIGVVSKQECWALAEVPSNIADWRAAPGTTLDEAKSLARTDCERNFGFCRIGLTFCADGSNRVGGTD